MLSHFKSCYIFCNSTPILVGSLSPPRAASSSIFFRAWRKSFTTFRSFEVIMALLGSRRVLVEPDDPWKSGWWLTYPSEKWSQLEWWHSIPNSYGKSIQIPWFQSTRNHEACVWMNWMNFLFDFLRWTFRPMVSRFAWALTCILTRWTWDELSYLPRPSKYPRNICSKSLKELWDKTW